MPKCTSSKLNRSGLLLALISSAFAGQVQAAAGRVEFAIGGATLSGPNGQQRPAAKGAEVNSGDVVRTAANGRVQVRMADGAYISLQPNTEFGIKNYKYEGKTDGSESAFFSLLKGAMRTVTGLIGRVNRDRYQVATPTATVGIRGTGGLIQIQDDGSTLVQGTSGIWFLANPSGSIDVPAGVSGVSPSDPNKPPQETGEAPTAGPAPLPPQEEYTQGNQTNPDGTAVVTTTAPPVLQSGAGYAGAFAYGANIDGILPVVRLAGGSAVFNGSGQLTSMTDVSGQALDTWSLISGSSVNFGTDGILAWGRWVGTAAVPDNPFGLETYDSNQGFHYVVGTPTPVMPSIGTATYTLLGATSPTYVDGGISPGTMTGSLNVNFGQQVVGVSITASMSDGFVYGIGGTAGINGQTFVGTTSQALTTSGSGCLSGCFAQVQGFFAGTSAERAGLAYRVSGSGGDVIGAAAFTKQ
jgi:hypothetical protein